MTEIKYQFCNLSELNLIKRCLNISTASLLYKILKKFGSVIRELTRNNIIIKKIVVTQVKMNPLSIWTKVGVIRKEWTDVLQMCQLKTPSRRGNQLIILNACGLSGCVPNTLLVTAKCTSNCRADYQSDMNHFVVAEWFEKELTPNLNGKFIIVYGQCGLLLSTRQEKSD